MSKFKYSCIFGTLLLAIFLISGCGENSVAIRRGALTGMVTDTNGFIVQDAEITSHRSLYVAVTDENGRYSFTSLDVGSHRLSIKRNGYYNASQTVELAYGQAMDGINIKLEALPNNIVYTLIKQSKTRVLIDIECYESMSVWVGWREKNGLRIQTPPTEVSNQHQVVLDSLFAGSEYIFEIEGITADGRQFRSSEGTFKTTPTNDISGAPNSVSEFKIAQSMYGPVLSWKYSGLDPLSGFRVFRSENDGDLSLLENEQMIFSEQNSFTDESSVPGRVYKYAIQSVDLAGDISEMSSLHTIVPAGEISEDILWTTNLSPILLSGDLIIPHRRTLTIEAGVTVLFNPEDLARSGYQSSMCELVVEGTMLAEGTVDKPIRLISSAALPSNTDWEGIRMVADDVQVPSVFKHLIISGAEKGISLNNSNYDIENITIRFCSMGLSINNASGTVLNDFIIESCDTAFIAERTYNCGLQNLIIREGHTGVKLAGNFNFSLKNFDIRNIRDNALIAVDRSAPSIRNGVLQSEKTGITIGSAGGDYQYLTIDAINGIIVDGASLPIIKNNIIVNKLNSGNGYGIEEKTLGRSYTYNNIFGFLAPTLSCDQNGAAIINIAPEFVGRNGTDYDYHLKSTSILMAASENNGQLGAYGIGN